MKKLFWAIIVLLVLLVFWLKTEYHKKDAPVQEQTSYPITVNVQKMQSVPIVLSHAYIGSIIPIHSVAIRPFIAGFIDEVYIKGGDFIDLNQPLFSLERGQYIAQLKLQMSNIMWTEQ